MLGEADIAICGGVEARIEAVPIAGFAQMRIVMSTNNDDPAGACRPFDRDRDGFVFGEGGALLVIETEEHAKARGANILGRVMGASITSDGFHMVAPDPNGERAGYAMSRGRSSWPVCRPTDIDHVNAHATGTSVGDVAESVAINNALGGTCARGVRTQGRTRALGRARSGAVESILTLLALRDGVIPPTRNLKNLDPEINLDVVAGEPAPRRLPLRDQQLVRLRRPQRVAGVRPALSRQALTSVNCPSSLMPRLKKSLQPIRYFMYRW